MLEDQGAKCPICKRHFTDEKVMSPHVDHDHDTRWIRGLTCQNCNTALGLFQDNVEWMKSAIEYVMSNATPTEFVFTKVPISTRKPT